MAQGIRAAGSRVNVNMCATRARKRCNSMREKAIKREHIGEERERERAGVCDETFETVAVSTQY